MASQWSKVVAFGGLAALALGALAAPASAAAPSPAARTSTESTSTGTNGEGPWVVSVGDSYISGEAGRWAGNSNDSESAADALGPTAYYDNEAGTAEKIERCHRSKSAEVYLGRGVNGLNLACSGAATTTYTNEDGYFKPGLDFADDGAGHVGQAAMLEAFAADHDVDVVVVSIGGNDFGFASVVERCVVNFLTSPEWAKNYCSDDDDIEAVFAPTNRAAVRAKIVTALRNIRAAMRAAGYGDRDWTLIAQTYPSPIPDGDGFRYSEGGWTRQFTGGCGFWNADADWANSTALPVINQTVKAAARKSKIKNTEVLNLSHAFDGRRLCEDTVGLYEEVGLESWTDPAAVDRTEWINQIRITAQDGSLQPDAQLESRAVDPAGGDSPYYLQESLHPNYWAQLATRSCLRKAYHGGEVRGGRCEIAGTGMVDGEPRMRLR